MLGFPIRTPPDHSLVANSPGLIAGSNVLHRLLMPRHPPCALHSLSQQRQDNTHKETTPAHPPIKEADQLIDATRQEKQATPELTRARHNTGPTSSSLNYLQPATTPTGTTQQVLPNRDRAAAKMLASTMQISNNNPTNTLDHPHGRPRAKGGPEQPTNKRLILQDPTVCLTPSPTNAGP